MYCFTEEILYKIFILIYLFGILEEYVYARKGYRAETTQGLYTKTICMAIKSPMRARRKSCFLRPDTGPCRADLVQWYFDVKQRRCYRFFWGGCQGNGNRFETLKECMNNCYLNETNSALTKPPHFCSLSFDYGSCFGHYNRWTYDSFSKTCRNRIYSGCGGNMNNFETLENCRATCVQLNAPNTLQKYQQYTTCVPYDIFE